MNPKLITTVESFSAIVANIMNELNISLDRLKTKRAPNGLPERIAEELNKAERDAGRPETWNASNVSKRYKTFQANGSLFPAIEHALGSERCEQSEPVSEKAPKAEHSEPDEHSRGRRLGSEQLERSEREEPPQKNASGAEPPEPPELAEQIDLDEPNDVSFAAEDLAFDIEPCSDPSEQSEHVGQADISERMKLALKALAREVFEQMISTVTNVKTGLHATSEDLPPEPVELTGTGRGGRRQVREYGKLSATVDNVLFELFRTECKERGLSAGRMLDAILWNHYNRPDLSYMRPDAEQRARERPKRQSTSRSE